MSSKLKDFWRLFTAFFRIGAFTFGGGFAMLPLIEKEVVDRNGWAERDEILDIFALAQSVPGAIGVNTAVFVGGRLYGIAGAIVALVGVITPSFLIILVIAHFFAQFKDNPYVASAFAGLRGAIIGLIGCAAVRVARTAIFDRFGLAVAVTAFFLSVSGIIPAVWLMVLGGLAGYLYYTRKKQEKTL